jgi:hypothetical protein
MPTSQTRTTLITDFAPNGVGAITGAEVQDFVASTLFDQGPWSSSTTYAINDLVQYLGVLWRCILGNINFAPPNGTYWTPLSSPLTFANDLTGQSAAITSLVSYTPAATGTFEVGGYVNITAVVTDVLAMQVVYTDENGSGPYTINLLAGIATTGNNSAPATPFRCGGGTSITVKVTLSIGGGTVTFDAGAFIRQVS